MLLLPLGMNAQAGLAQCEPDIAGLESSLPTEVNMQLTGPPGTPDQEFFFSINVTDLTLVLEGNFGAWCVDRGSSLNESYLVEDVQVFSSYADVSNFPKTSNPENFDQVNWVLNQDLLDQGYTYGHIQYAIWTILGEELDCTSDPCNNQFLTDPYGNWASSDFDKAAEIVTMAGNSGVGFEPGCGELLGIVLIPETKQSVIISLEVPEKECVTECVIVATDEAKIDKDNTVSGGDVCEDPSEDVIPTFYTNTVSDGDSPDLKVEAEDGCVTTDLEVFDKVEVKEGGCLIFTGKNIFIKELKVEKHTTIKFEDCANLIIDHDLRFEEFTTFNPDMEDVTLYVDGNVEVKKGSNISAHIYADDNDIKAEGKVDSPTTMKGVFVAKKVEGKYFVNWIGNAYCDPCPVEYPEPEPTCECNGGMTSVTFTYDGLLTDLSTNSGSITDNGDGTFTVAVNPGQDKLEKDLEITANGVTGEIHTSCSQDILGGTFGSITVVAHVDTDGNLATLENCGSVQGSDCKCEGGMTSVTFTFAGDLTDLTTNSGSIADNGDGTFTVAVNPGQDKLEKNLVINGAEIHTSCSQDILGVTFAGGITVVGYIDTKGNITSVDGCGQLPPGPDCECDGGIVSATFTYEGTLPILSSDDNNAAFTDNGDGTVTLATFDGDKLSNPDIFVNAINEGEFHASCSQNLLGKMYGVLTVISYIDAEGGEISLENCPADPVECDCSGGLRSITLAYTGSGSLSTNSGSITDNGNGTFTISTSDKLEKDLEISVNGVVEAIVHTSCSDDILGNVNASKSSFGDSGAFPDPVEGDNNGTFLVISHTDTNGNVCSIDYTPSFRTSMITMEEAKPVISEFSVNAWPNPSDNQFYIKVLSPNVKDKVNIEVFDMRSRTIHKDQFNGALDYSFGQNLNAGLYFVRIQQGDSVETIKLMKR